MERNVKYGGILHEVFGALCVFCNKIITTPFVDDFRNLYFGYSAYKIVVVLYETKFNSIVKCHVVVWKWKFIERTGTRTVVWQRA